RRRAAGARRARSRRTRPRARRRDGTGCAGDGQRRACRSRGGPRTIRLSTVGLSTVGQATVGQAPIRLPTIRLPTVRLPTVGLPTVGLPTVGLPTVSRAFTLRTVGQRGDLRHDGPGVPPGRRRGARAAGAGRGPTRTRLTDHPGAFAIVT
ncbi:MAG TPA: hypothetical protein VGE11_06990, partial [Pseudonocardia sp.]